jgi:hypothetical protein
LGRAHPWREQLVRVVAVEDDAEATQPQQRHGRRHLVDHHHAAHALARDQHHRAPQHAQRGARDVQPTADRARQEAAGDVHGERAVARLLEAARGVVVCRVHLDVPPQPLQGQRRVDDEALGAADAEVGVDEAHALAAPHEHAGLLAQLGPEQRGQHEYGDQGRV